MSDEEIVTAYRHTGSIWKAAKHLGLCGQSVHERLRRLGYPTVHEEWSLAELHEAQRLAVQGEPLAQIAARIGRTYSAVALKLSRTGVASRHKAWRYKPNRVHPIPRARVHEFAVALSQEGWSVRRLARREGLAITPLVSALQTYEPEAWKRYVAIHSKLARRVCPGCRTRFRPLTGKQRYCTVGCRESHRRNLAYFGGRRLEAVGLLEGVCQLCGKQSTKWLSAHHLLGRENDPGNAALIALCRGCHDLVGRLSARPWVERPEVIEVLVALALARRGRVGASVSVGIEDSSEHEVDDGIPPSSPRLHRGHLVSGDGRFRPAKEKYSAAGPGDSFAGPGDTLKWPRFSFEDRRMHTGRDGSR